MGRRTGPRSYRSPERSAGEVVLREPIRVERGDGSEVVIEVDAAPITRNEGKVIEGAVTTFQDVTDRLETQIELARAARRISQIQAITDATLTGMAFDELAERLLWKLREILDTDSATLLLLDRSGALLHEHATVGVDTEDHTTAIPVGAGIAGKIAATVAPLVVTDLSSYEVVRPWLSRTMRSLIGAPLVYRGRVTGVIHVATRNERAFSVDDVELLELAANRIASALERASLYDGRSAMSAALQRSLLPSSLPEIPGVDLAALYLPFTPDDEIGGDFYDVFPHGEGTWGVVIGDVSGKGPEAAAIMGLAAHSVRVLARYESRPSVGARVAERDAHQGGGGRLRAVLHGVRPAPARLGRPSPCHAVRRRPPAAVRRSDGQQRRAGGAARQPARRLRRSHPARHVDRPDAR